MITEIDNNILERKLAIKLTMKTKRAVVFDVTPIEGQSMNITIDYFCS